MTKILKNNTKGKIGITHNGPAMKADTILETPAINTAKDKPIPHSYHTNLKSKV